MKKPFRKFYPVILAGLILLASGCEKLSDEELLTDHAWTWDKMTTTSTNTDVQNLVTVLSALMTNAVFVFRSDGTYSLTALNSTDEGTWELSDDGKILTMDDDPMTIVKLTKDQLVMEGEEVNNTYGTYTTTMYLKK